MNLDDARLSTCGGEGRHSPRSVHEELEEINGEDVGSRGVFRLINPSRMDTPGTEHLPHSPSRSSTMGQTPPLRRLLPLWPSQQRSLRDHLIRGSGPGAGISTQRSRSILQHLSGSDSQGRMAVC